MRITAAQLVPVEVLPEPVALALASIAIDVDGHATEDGGFLIPVAIPGLADLDLDLGVDGVFQLRLHGITGGAVYVGEMVELRPLGAAELDLPLLLRALTVDGEAWIDTDRLDPVTVELTGALGIDGEGSVHAVVESFDVPPFEVGNSGLRLALTDCGLALSSGDLPESRRPPGADADFVGLHAASAQARWLEPLAIDGLPGLRLDLERILVGSSGVSCDLTQTFAVATSGTAITGGDLVGHLFGEQISVALETVSGSIVENEPTSVAATGLLRLGPLDLLLDLDFGLERRDDERWVTTFAVERREGVGGSIGVGPGALTVDDLRLDGELRSDGFDLSGRISGALDVGPVQLPLAEATASWKHSEGLDALEFQLGGLELGPIGTVDLAKLKLTARATDGGQTLVAVAIDGEASWDGLADRLNLPVDLPAPPDEGRIGVHVEFEEKTPGEWDWVVRLTLGLEDADALWPFVPEAVRPEARDFELVGEIRWDAAAAGDTSAEEELAASFHGELSVRLPELPEFPGDDLLVLEMGDEEGWMRARVELEASTGGGGSSSFELTLEDVMSAAVNLPGLPSAVPPFATELDEVSLEIGTGSEGVSGKIVLGGDFVVRPLSPADLDLPLPPEIAVQAEKLFAAAGISDIVGEAETVLEFDGDGVQLTFTGEFEEGAELEVDLFDVFSGLTAGAAGPDVGDDASELDLDLELGVALKRMRLQLGSLEEDGPQVELSATLVLSILGQDNELTITFSEEEFSIEAGEVSIPIAIPELPMTLDDLAVFEGPGGAWTLSNAWSSGGSDAAKAAIEARAQEILDQLDRATEIEEELTGLGIGPERADLEEELRLIRDVEVPGLQYENLHAAAHRFLLDAVQAVSVLLSTDANRATFQGFVSGYQAVLDETLGHLGAESGLYFTITGARFLIPFDDPANLRVEGGARISVDDLDGPLGFLSAIAFKMGLSADAIFFAVEGGADPIALPGFGRYEGTSVEIDQLYVGYGYNKNSLVVSFAGGLNLPENLVEDLDTSDLIGAGVRLPTTSAVSFKLDLIPVVLGEVDLIIPLFEYDVDLRTPGVPPIADSARCEPAWDGLQVIAPGFRADFKSSSYSLFYGPVPASNFTLAYDVAVGGPESGVTHVCANYLTISPVAGALYIPTLFDTTPFFDHLCTSVRLAGFELTFDLQRPFPSVEPMVLIELMGFLSDPTMEVHPDSDLANIVRATLADAKLRLPPAIVGMFGEQGTTVEFEGSYSINLATVIALGRGIVDAFERTAEATEAAAGDMQALVAHLQSNPPDISPAGILRMLPPELRRLTLNGSFAGFDATASILLLPPEELAQEFDRLVAAGVTADSQLVLEADFGGELEGWIKVDPQPGKRGKWRTSGGVLRQSANTGESVEPRRGTQLVLDRKRFDEFVLQTAVRSTDDDGVGVVFGWLSVDEHLRFRIGKQTGRWVLERVAGGQAVELFGVDDEYEKGRRYSVTIAVRRSVEDSVVHAASAGLSASGGSLASTFGAGIFGAPVLRSSTAVEALSSSEGLSSAAASTSAARIEVWVDQQLWCSVPVDASDYRAGSVGFESWWNAGSTFEFLRVYGEAAASIEPGSSGESALELLSRQRPNIAGGEVPFAWGDATFSLLGDAELFDGFSFEDVESIATPQTDSPAVCVAARVRALGEQRFGFVGLLHADGHFALASRLKVEPLELRVLGVEVPLGLDLDARLRLSGRSAGADSEARIEAEGHAQWTPLPGLVEIDVATAHQPASLSIGSDGSFRVAGGVEARLFGGAATLDGDVEVTQAHALLSGSVSASADLDGTELFALELGVDEGRVGPGSDFALAGGGELSVLGRPLLDVEGRIDETGGAVRGRIGLPEGESWSVAGFAIERAELALSGDLRFGGALPDLILRGEGVLGAMGAELSGQGGFVARADHWELFGEGNLHWQGRDWLSGFLRIGSDGLALGGTTRFALELTTDQLPTNVDGKVAGLYFEAEVSGNFELASDARLEGCGLQVIWALGVKLPNAPKQMIPMASGKLELTAPPAGGQGSIAKLLHIDKLDLLPLDGVTIPVPTLDFDGGTTLYVGSMPVGGGSDTISVPTVTTTKPSGSPNPLFVLPTGLKKPTGGWLGDLWGWVNILEDLEFDNFWLGSASRTISIPSVAVPTIGFSEPDGPSTPITIPIPGAVLDEPVRALLDNLDFDLHLAWRDGELGIQVGSSAGGFHAFADMFYGAGYIVPGVVNRVTNVFTSNPS